MSSSIGQTSQWTAKWCFTRKQLLHPWNYYALFRRQIHLPAQPARAVVRVSADSRYTLYVNGQRVHQGPARAYPENYAYDTLDLTDLLQAGENTIGAIVHQFGIPTYQNVYRGAAGFLLDGAIEADGKEHALHTPHGWMCRPAKGWRRDVARLSMQLGFQEHFDADADPPDWLSPAYLPTPENGWREPDVHGPVGCAPWLRMEPRGIPLLMDRVHAFEDVLGQYVGEDARGYKIAADVYHLPQQETRRKDKAAIVEPLAMLRDDEQATTVNPPADGEFAVAVLSLGQYRTGHLMLDIADAAGDEIIDIIYAEDLDKGGFPLILPADERYEAVADRYRCRPGAQRWEPFFYKGMRYVALIFRNVEKPLKIRHVGVRQISAGVEDAGSFECSDERLNQIWRIGRETQRNCLFDAFVDCPWRELAMWWGDARVQARVTAYAFGDTSLLERGIRLIARSQAPDGSLHAHPPTDTPKNRLPDFMMTWVGTLWDYYFHTGKTELLRECLPALQRLFEFFQAHEVRDGLVGNFDGFWVFLDWQELYKHNLSGALNLMYLQSLRWAAAVCDAAGDDHLERLYSTRAQSVAAAIERYFWNPTAKCWIDGWDPATERPVELVSQHTNALAILLKLKPETRATIARDILVKPARTKRSKVLTGSPFFYAYILEAIVEAGLRDQVVDIIREKWGAMLDRGATTFWELWEVKNDSRCHAWSASPVYHLSQQVLGVVPVDVGWKQVRIAPLPGDLEFARGVVPSPLGPIRVDWEKVEEDQLALRVDIPQGMEAEFVNPLGESRVLGPGGHEFHT